MKNLTWHSKLVLAIAAFLPIYFMIAALGTKIGLWSWQTGLIGMTFAAGQFLLGILAIVALVSLILGLVRKPRRQPVVAIGALGLIVAGALALFGLSTGIKAGNNPIHDVATDTADPPALSAETLAQRAKTGANPLNNYQIPLSELPMYAGVSPELAIKHHAQIIIDTYDLRPLPLGGATTPDAMAAVAAAMDNMGFTDIRQDAAVGRVEGVAETFWYGFKDDVVARIDDREINFRSVSRVGTSDLGANAARLTELRANVAQKIGDR